MKECSKCGQIKPLDEFYANKNYNPDQRHGKCKECFKVANKVYYESVVAIDKNKQHQYYHNKKIKSILINK